MPVFFATLFVPAVEHFEFVQHRHSLQLNWELICLGISLLGLSVRMLTVAYIREGSSGRELSSPGAERLNTTGFYSVVRHPLYLGNSIIWLGVASMLHQWWLSITLMLISFLYHSLIIMAEETYLCKRFGSTYREWAQKTPAFIPAFHCWTPPRLPFSIAMVLRREYSGLFQIAAVFSLMNMILHHVERGVWVLDPVFQILLITVTLFCSIIWVVVRWTFWLPAPGIDYQMDVPILKSTDYTGKYFLSEQQSLMVKYEETKEKVE
jgi:protein-S-isoprenylcysteine O-methyltransferase Ste14